jgi:hypothetical protein
LLESVVGNWPRSRRIGCQRSRLVGAACCREAPGSRRVNRCRCNRRSCRLGGRRADVAIRTGTIHPVSPYLGAWLFRRPGRRYHASTRQTDNHARWSLMGRGCRTRAFHTDRRVVTPPHGGYYTVRLLTVSEYWRKRQCVDAKIVLDRGGSDPAGSVGLASVRSGHVAHELL